MGKSGSGGAEIGRQVVSAKKTWVQTERAAHEAWAGLIARAPRAAMLLHHFVALMGEKNAVVISQKTLAKMLGVTDRTVRSAIADLVAQRWISVVKLNGPGTVSAYVVNDRVAWASAATTCLCRCSALPLWPTRKTRKEPCWAMASCAESQACIRGDAASKRSWPGAAESAEP